MSSPYYCKVVVGLGSQFCTLLEVWVLGVGMSTLDPQTSLYTEDRGIQVPMSLEHDIIVGTQCCDNTVPRLVRPDPKVRQRILPSRYVQIYWNGPHCVSRVVNKTNKSKGEKGRGIMNICSCQEFYQDSVKRVVWTPLPKHYHSYKEHYIRIGFARDIT